MKNTECNPEVIASFLTSAQTLNNLLDLVKDFDLEITGLSLS